ncbi:AbgT family transporter, partial [Vibrio parahaemolyticus]|nr:AbgT family transporter [Vibrio parahaemolyticus]EKA4402306.1 AbgT family transporter [Vibrio parahaemolyticus]
IGPILVPMLMAVGISPELSQAAYRVGDSVSNIISPLMVFFPLVVVYCQRYVKSTGIGTLASLMMPFSIAMLIGWSIFLVLYWMVGIPLGIQAPYTYTM